MPKATIRRIGRNLGIVFPKAVVKKYHLAEGTKLHIVATGEEIILTPVDSELAEWMKAFDRTNKKFHRTFAALAK